MFPTRLLVPLLAGSLCFAAGVSAGLWLSARAAKPAPCPPVDMAAVRDVVERAVKAHAVRVQPFDVGKIKRVRGFTYAPVYCGCPCAPPALEERAETPRPGR